jgi:hypothetical protein
MMAAINQPRRRRRGHLPCLVFMFFFNAPLLCTFCTFVSGIFLNLFKNFENSIQTRFETKQTRFETLYRLHFLAKHAY